jgi:hypothetical protein
LLLVVTSAAIGALLSNLRQVTSEIGRLWLMLGSAWFFFMRGTPFAERLARTGSSTGSLARYLLPLAFVVLVLIGAMVVTRDMGPLLIAGLRRRCVSRRIHGHVDAPAMGRDFHRVCCSRWRFSRPGSPS